MHKCIDSAWTCCMKEVESIAKNYDGHFGWISVRNCVFLFKFCQVSGAVLTSCAKYYVQWKRDNVFLSFNDQNIIGRKGFIWFHWYIFFTCTPRHCSYCPPMHLIAFTFHTKIWGMGEVNSSCPNFQGKLSKMSCFSMDKAVPSRCCTLIEAWQRRRRGHRWWDQVMFLISLKLDCGWNTRSLFYCLVLAQHNQNMLKCFIVQQGMVVSNLKFI